MDRRRQSASTPCRAGVLRPQAAARQVPTAAPAESISCPRCGSCRVKGHGSFRWHDGTRRPRYRCLDCGRTFNPSTGTPVAYLKKRDRWDGLAECIVLGLSVRKAAALMQVCISTAFHWRHRVLSGLNARPRPQLVGAVAVTEAYIRYSEKGSRRSNGPGSRGRHLPDLRPFRTLIEGRPSFVLLASDDRHHVAVVIGQGRPPLPALQSCLGQVVGAGAHLCSSGPAPYEAACRELGIPHQQGQDVRWRGGALGQALKVVELLRMDLYQWLGRFRGIATRYLANYLAWFLFLVRMMGGCMVGAQFLAAARRLLSEAGAGEVYGLAA